MWCSGSGIHGRPRAPSCTRSPVVRGGEPVGERCTRGARSAVPLPGVTRCSCIQSTSFMHPPGIARSALVVRVMSPLSCTYIRWCNRVAHHWPTTSRRSKRRTSPEPRLSPRLHHPGRVSERPLLGGCTDRFHWVPHPAARPPRPLSRARGTVLLGAACSADCCRLRGRQPFRSRQRPLLRQARCLTDASTRGDDHRGTLSVDSSAARCAFCRLT